MNKFIVVLNNTNLIFVLNNTSWYLKCMNTNKSIKVRKGEMINLLNGLYELNHDIDNVSIDPIELILGALL